MAAAGHPGEDARLYDAVRAVGVELCPALGIAIPVGKDSMSMRTGWEADGKAQSVTAPLSLIVTAFAPVTDVRRALTPELRPRPARPSCCSSISAAGKNRLGGSALAQVYGALGDVPPDLDDPALLRGFFAAVQELNAAGLLLAYHDRSDGGLFVTLLEMAFAGGVGLDLDLGDARAPMPLAALFTEELGAVLAGPRAPTSSASLATLGAPRPRRPPSAGSARRAPTTGSTLRRGRQAGPRGARARFLRGLWSETTHAMQALRDDPTCADEEQAARVDADDPGLSAHLTFDLDEDVAAPLRARGGARPRVAILREQGVNGQIEMAAAFDRAGFDAVDVHMTDILVGRASISPASAGWPPAAGSRTATCSAPGEGWAKSILFNARARDAVRRLLRAPRHLRARRLQRLPDDVGAQGADPRRRALAALRAQPQRAVRGAPGDGRDRRDARRCCWPGMAGSRMPIAVAHGEGRAEFADRRRRPRARGARPRRGALRRPPRTGRPSATRRTPTARPTASPRSPPPTAASRS